MSNVLDKNEVLLHIQNSVNKLNNAMTALAESVDTSDLKKASLLSYWIEEYVDYLQDERTFSSSSLIRYKAGDIIQVNFGFRIGSELGGLHYAIVLDKKNSKNSPIVTVVPLGSLKANFKETKCKFELETGLFELVQQKAQSMIERTKIVLDKLTQECAEIEGLPEKEKEIRIEPLKKKIEKLGLTIKRINRLASEIEKMNYGSTVDVGQIVTISKQRIYNPKKSDDVLFGIRASEQDMKKIYNCLQKNFIKNMK